MVGGGFGGARVAKSLQGRCDVTLVDTKPCFEYTPALPELIVNPGKEIQIPHREYLTEGRLVVGRARVFHDHVRMNGERLDFDALVVATGAGPKRGGMAVKCREDVWKLVEELGEEVAVAGGGYVGVEVAAGLAEIGKKVRLIHSRERLLHTLPERASGLAERFLRAQGVEVVLGERADVKRCVSCTGTVPNTACIKGRLRKALDEKGFVRVDGHLRVRGFENIFAVGDVTDIREDKSAQNAFLHASVASRNILALERRAPPREYRSRERATLVSLGSKNGIFAYRGLAFGGRIPAVMKKAVEWKVRLALRG